MPNPTALSSNNINFQATSFFSLKALPINAFANVVSDMCAYSNKLLMEKTNRPHLIPKISDNIISKAM